MAMVQRLDHVETTKVEITKPKMETIQPVHAKKVLEGVGVVWQNFSNA